MNAIYRHLSDKFLFPAVLGVSLLMASSCVKTLDEQPIPLAGKWAKVDGAFMTSEYVEFKSGEMNRYEAGESKIIRDGTIWNSSESDFKKNSSGSYSVRDGKLFALGKDLGTVIVNGEELMLGNIKYLRILKFTNQESSSISIQEEVTCDYHSREITVVYNISDPLPDSELEVSCPEDWIEDISVSTGNIYFFVRENNTGSARKATLTLKYPGTNTKVLSINQSYSAPGITVTPVILSSDYTGGNYSINYTIENPRESESLQVTCPDPWITDISVFSNRVTFSVSENQSFQPRQSKLSFSYAGIDKVVLVSQKTDNDKSTDVSSSGTANCYIVSSAGSYKFPAVKGNSNESVGPVSSVEVLWESFGTNVTPQVGDLISDVLYLDNMVYFMTSGTFRDGNALIAVKDASGNILWSWHIWLTDKPEDQVYNNSAGTMMDRNLGATSATPGKVVTFGLLYQWGRKDPFLGSSSISKHILAKSTIEWPSPVESTASTGTIDYAVSNPVTFILGKSNNCDWYYAEDKTTDDTRWQTKKTIYDPCPPGYRVPDGGDNGVWSKAFGTSSRFDENVYNKGGFNFGSSGAGTIKLSNSASVCWYPAAGYLDFYGGSLSGGDVGHCWSCSPDGRYACDLFFDYFGYVRPSHSTFRANGYSVRCLKE